MIDEIRRRLARLNGAANRYLETGCQSDADDIVAILLGTDNPLGLIWDMGEWLSQYERLEGELAKMRKPMPCGHPHACVVSSDEGTNYCAWCEDRGQLLDRLEEGNRIYAELVERFQGYRQFHPRAVKLLDKGKPFVVVACDEPYYRQVYEMIRQREMEIGRWSEDDERRYQAAICNLEDGE